MAAVYNTNAMDLSPSPAQNHREDRSEAEEQQRIRDLQLNSPDLFAASAGYQQGTETPLVSNAGNGIPEQDPDTLPSSARLAVAFSQYLPCLAMVLQLTKGRATIKSFTEIPRPTVTLTFLADDWEEMRLRQFWVNTELEYYQLHIYNVNVLIGVLYKYYDEIGRSSYFIVNTVLEYEKNLLGY